MQSKPNHRRDAYRRLLAFLVVVGFVAIGATPAALADSEADDPTDDSEVAVADAAEQCFEQMTEQACADYAAAGVDVSSVGSDQSEILTGQSGASAAHSARARAAEQCLERDNESACVEHLTKSIGSGFTAVTDFSARGPYPTVSASEGPSCTIFRPAALGERGLRHPVILWGNGTGASPAIYGPLLDHWASHGFVVAAAQTPNAGTGVQMLDCLDYLIEQNGQTEGTYARTLNTFQVGTSGHSQGGGGAIMAGRDSRIRATAPLQPFILGLGHEPSASSQQHGPMLLMSGSLDFIAGPILNQGPVFNAANVPVFWGILQGAGHFVPLGNAGAYRGPTTAWFRLHLMQDETAESLFYGPDCDLCVSSSWSVSTRDIP